MILARRHLLVAGSLLLGLLGCGADRDKPGFRVFPDMADSTPYNYYDAHPSLPNNMAAQLPPVGTVPVSGGRFLYGPEVEEAERAGRELVNPLTADAETLARGAREFGNKCQVCHGPEGAGDGPIIGRFPNPPNLTANRARDLPDGRLYHIMTHGQGIMPSHGAQVLPMDRWRLVLHVRELQRAVPRQDPVFDDTTESGTENGEQNGE